MPQSPTSNATSPDSKAPPADGRGDRRRSAPIVRMADWLRQQDDDGTDGVSGQGRTKYRTVFVSDFHLGTSGCSAELLLDFLKSIECDTLYLVGDIIDGWRLRKGWYWPAAHNDVVRCVLKMAKYGTRVVYIPGNHDDLLRDFFGLHFGDLELVPDDIHVTADGRRLLVIHGDQFDNVVMYHKWLAFLGDGAYTLLLKSNSWVNAVRRLCGLPYWSLAAHMKRRVKNAVQFISRFEEVVAEAAAKRGVDGVVCGHIHAAEIRRIGEIDYYNDGDWVESCTALVEHGDGRMEILDWAARDRARQRDAVRTRAGRAALSAPALPAPVATPTETVPADPRVPEPA